MKEFLIYAAAGYAVLQVLLVMAVLAAAARPTPAFEPEITEFNNDLEVHERQEELELV